MCMCILITFHKWNGKEQERRSIQETFSMLRSTVTGSANKNTWVLTVLDETKSKLSTEAGVWKNEKRQQCLNG